MLKFCSPQGRRREYLVNPGSKAALRGIREGDLISSINGQGTKSLTNIEAHGLLRNAGEILKLGLNEDPGGSPKRRQYRTVHQETLQETVKRSSFTTYSLTKIVESVDSQSDKDNESLTEKNGHASINGTSKSIPHSNILVTKKPSSSSSSSPTLTKEDLKTNSSENALASQRSSYTNCTLSPSSPSILSEDGTCSCSPSQDNGDKENETLDNMNDNQGSSRSQRRRQRRKNQNRKITESRNDCTRNTDCDNAETADITETENVLPEEYTVQSPVELVKDKNAKKSTKPVKSRSLDDDEMVNIQEVSEISDSENKEKETEAIVSEASESEVEWEETADLNTPPPVLGSLSTFTLPLQGCVSEQITLISPEEEKNLRDFLESLNLVNGPEEAANQVNDKDSPESIKQRKARKKAELEQYFLPIYQNPRYLDVISEESRESSDRDSDREQSKSSLTRVLRKGTPENNVPPKVPPRPNRDRRKIPSKFTTPVDQDPAVLVDTKLIDTPEKSEAVCSTFTTGEEATASNVEIVYLTSSETDSAEELESNSSDSYVIISERSSNEDLSEKTLVNVKTDETVSNAQELTHIQKSDHESNKKFEEIIKPNESERTLSSTQYSFTIKSNKDFTDKNDNIVNIDMLNQLTPPPTPDNTSPNDSKETAKIDLDSLVFLVDESNLKMEPETYTDALTPPPPSRSSSSSRSTSRESSLCTARYNPSVSSITDVIALTKEEMKEGRYFQALTLREICLQFLLSLPFGKDILEELADVSKYIESYTSSLPSAVLPKLVPNLAPFVDRAHSNSNNLSYNLSVHLPPKVRQEDITYIKNIPKIEKTIDERALLTEKQIFPATNKNETYNDNLNANIFNTDDKKTMERKILIQVDPEYKASKSSQKEVLIPVIIGKNVEATTKKEIGKHEVVIPITIEKEANERNEKSSQKVIEKISVQSESEKLHKSKEVPIPIQIENEDHNKPKEVIIPITIQKDANQRNEKSSQKVTQIPVKIDKEKHKPKEVIIPVNTSMKIEKTTDQKIEKSSQKVTESSKVKKLIHIGEDTNKNKPQDVIIPIKRENIDEELVNKSKEFIIPITKEVSESKTETKTMESLSEQKEKIIRKEVIIPITKDETSSGNEIGQKTKEHKEVNIPIMKEWTGLPTERDPKLLLCLSPKQKEELEKSKQIPDEASKLIELHEKFINRRSSHEVMKKETEERVTITGTNHHPSNRLLTIIKEEPTSGSNEDKNYLYFVEKAPILRQQSFTLPREMDSARLNAKDLNEWLNLARNKSMSESNLTTVPDIPENNLRNNFNMQAAPTRRTSLPHDLFEKQMIYIQEKEREIQRQLEALEDEKRLLNAEMAPSRQFHADDYYFSRQGDFAESKTRPLSMPMMPTEYFRQQMYEEYMDKFAEREERKQHKIIKVTSSKDINQESEETTKKEIIHPIQIEDEFMNKVQELQKEGKLEKVKSVEKEKEGDKNQEADEPPVLVMDGEKLKEAKELPKHLQEFVGPDGIWSPGQKFDLSPKEFEKRIYESQHDDGIPPVWTPKSANSSPVSDRKEFRPVNFQSPVLGRRNRTTSENLGSQKPSQAHPWKNPDYSSDTGSASSFLDRRLPTSRSTPASGFSDLSTASRLPKAQNPTITLLQKAREGQLPKGASYLDQEPRQYKPRNERPPIAGPGEVLYQIKNEYTSESDNERPRKMTDLGQRKFEGIGPVSKDGLPLVLRSDIKDQNQSKWYKRMYDTIHKQKPHNAQYPYTSGYLSEPEPGAYDSDFTDYKYQTLDRRRPLPQDRSSDYINSTMPRPTVNRSSSSDIVRNTQDYYKTPGRIENYTPGRSSIADKEAKQWWDEVMDIFDGHLEQQNKLQPQAHPKSFINQCLKETGYESDSTLVFRRREEAAQQLSPKEQREAYKVIQKGGDVPLHGLRKLAPEKPKETEYVEFFPISPTLTRIRIHKNIKPQKEVICYPVTVHHDVQNTFSAYKRTAPSSAIPTPPPIPPPSPPRRKSSRNNPTLRLVSTMKVTSAKSPLCKRHETCFTTSSNIDKSKVNYLKDKITCKLSPTMNKRSTSPKIKVVKKVTTSPDLKNKITSTLTTSKDIKTSTRKIQSKTNIIRSKSTDSVTKTTKSTAKKSPINSSMESLNMRNSPRTFGSEKKKFDLHIKPPKLVKSPDLVSPTEVKKATMMHSPSGTIYKRTSVPLSSSKISGKPKDFLPVKVGISDRGRSVLKTGSPIPTSPKLTRLSPSPSTSSSRAKTSFESLISPKLPKKKLISKSVAPSKLKTKDTQKSKKEQINDEIKKDIRTSKAKSSLKKTINKTDSTQTATKLYKRSDQNDSILNDIRKQKDAIESHRFFQHLFLRDLSPTPSNASKSSWIVEKTNQLHRRRSSFPEPSVNAMKVYLKHTRPVTDSKFISLDMATIRSRSASPRSVTFEDDTKTETKEIPKRSSSLPAKLIFSQTSRPVSPVVLHNKLVSPPPSPKLCRSPSCRRIMQYKTLQERKPPEYSFYMCPSLNQSNTSLDSLRSEDYYKYFNEVVHSTKLGEKFKDLNQFYSEIEKVGQLEKIFSVKPRTKNEAEIIDFDRWKEVRTRERAEQELLHLYNQIRKEEKDKGFLYMPKDVNRYRWKRESDRGLRIKEKSVDDIKEEFEKIKFEESDRENAKRRELAFLKDTYKPLWRGFSVANIANSIGDGRSHSEGRVKTARQRLIDSEKLLNHGIGSRIWSSLSMEQVNILKDQLAEIYNNYPKNQEDFSIHVPKDKKKVYVPTLTVRRNSDSSERIYKAPLAVKEPDMSESAKKMMSYTLSKELLEKLAKQRKENKLALPIVVGKEVLGAVASADANIKSDTKKEEPKQPLVKTNALINSKIPSASETESGSTDESTRTVICLEKGDDIKKKVEYFEHVKEQEAYVPTIYKPAETTDEIGDSNFYSLPEPQEYPKEKSIYQSKSCQSLKEYFGEKELMKFATIPLSATRKQKFSPKKPELRSIDISPIRSEISVNTSNDSIYRSRSTSPYLTEKPPVNTGEVSRLRNKFEYLEDIYGSRSLKRSRSDSDLNSIYPHFNYGYVDSLRRKYEYPAHAGRGRSRTRRGGVVSPMFLRAEDRFMPHINIISKIASLYTRKNTKNGNKKHYRSMEELAEILGCPVGEVEKIREKFDSQEDISLMGHMYTSSPSIRELKDIAPYLTANWTAHRYPKFEDNTRSLSSPEHSVGSRDTSMVRKDKPRPKSTSPPPKSKKSLSILKPVQKSRSTDFFKNQKYDPKIHEPVSRYQPSDVARYRNGWSVCSKPTVSFKEPEPPVPPPKGIYARNLAQESPRKYMENEVTIHYKTPVRQEIKDFISEDELAHRQAETMKKIYQEERRKKYLQVSKSLQELQDMNSRRHTDNFIPSQKSPISLNRYDDFDDLAPNVRPRARSPEHRLCARALYNFVGQSARELTFRKGDIIYLRRQIDKNWYEGELNAMVGLFPANYVEIIPFEGTKAKTTLRKAHEGQARAKYNFVAQTHLELSLAKGELVVVTRKIDENWFEGKIGGRKGIFPANYVEMLIDPATPPPPSSKPVAAPASHSLLLNGSSGGKDSMGSHSYTPSLPNAPQLTSSYHAKPVQVLNSGNYSSLSGKHPGISQALHIETQSEPIPYRAMYKYKPQNEDELELLEGDTVFVLEKCDDGWYVGSSERTGAFGTFPGNYVEKI